MIHDTIIAQATPQGVSGVAVLRLSGKNAYQCALLFIDREDLKPRYAHYVTLRHPHTKDVLDYALMLYFPAPHSFTGEDVVEIHCHGSRMVIRSVIDAALSYEGVRYAQAGEFTRRACEHGKLDLLQAEALADLIAADTPKQQKLACRHLSGAASQHYIELERAIIEARAFCEVFIDFPDDDLPEDLDDQINEKINSCIAMIHSMLQYARAGKHIRDGIRVAIMGVPNAGKSTLINRIAGRHVAIASPVAGTTRDAIECSVVLNGVVFQFFDTAGLRTSTDDIEVQGINIAKNIAAQADVVLIILDRTQSLGAQIESVGGIVSRETIWAANKIDAPPHPTWNVSENVSRETILISSQTGEGVTHLVNRLIEFTTEVPMEDIYITRDRHIEHLNEALQSLLDAHGESQLVLKAEHTLHACNYVGFILGRIDIERVLDALFSSFCIGK
ncbi:MAG: tRNA uridine-5-carboxymethylaminomethyl(34) synthesis GTPase MnmE [Alphaproteobacteria bacterium]|nr:MAG: tRNA uridine-5-carboxymethylaminomethyl(34) synthesis GTPase MnmE [Alphaproteobacteria bacterium]TAF15718.1 MAG: tRNA uridine-5-carboxymethylaminomethyl(34) synthesis GTPase MnmE [Alphaproteobacteria bacterium]TAF40823.1 MAG: tRNA uridine-5-carboxymethylaminomethyl(34) synthesis GTPase MnmE [Alphaproteobacteria bacterium]TAF77011.1 MAG: tRNA uridine-5-carboxymethylaminomethyl(34) synthesis GTPase MnmE [Alphaproteobacteria bacterium]